MTTYYVCQICGHVAKNTPPRNCPVCNAVQEKFSTE
ncbi:rubredoxin-like domain-containing protein [Thermodesulfobacteriota bacterium]